MNWRESSLNAEELKEQPMRQMMMALPPASDLGVVEETVIASEVETATEPEGEAGDVEAAMAVEVGPVTDVAVGMTAEATRSHSNISRTIFRSSSSSSSIFRSSVFSGKSNHLNNSSLGDEDHRPARGAVNLDMSLPTVPLQCLHFIIPCPRIHTQTTLSLGNIPQRSQAGYPLHHS